MSIKYTLEASITTSEEHSRLAAGPFPTNANEGRQNSQEEDNTGYAVVYEDQQRQWIEMV